MRAELVSYLLGDLDDSTRQAIEERLKVDPELRDELERVRECLEGSDSKACSADAEYDLPDGLADRTADSVTDLAIGLNGLHQIPPDATSPPPTEASSRCSFRLVDATVAMGVMLALTMMLLPALSQCRDNSRRLACENNMRELGKVLVTYANQNHEYFPHVRPGENAGVFAVRLAENQLATQEQLREWLLCPGSQLQEQVTRGVVIVRVPTRQQLQQANQNGNLIQLTNFRRTMGGSYAYRLGYVHQDRYMPVKNLKNERIPVLSDRPTKVGCAWKSVNHGDCGQNVLYQDGHVDYLIGSHAPVIDDHLYINRSGEPAAGTNFNDVVLVGSEVTPGIMPAITRSSRVPRTPLPVPTLIIRRVR